MLKIVKERQKKMKEIVSEVLKIFLINCEARERFLQKYKVNPKNNAKEKRERINFGIEILS